MFNDLYIDPSLVAEFEKLKWEKYFEKPKYDNYYVFTNNMVPSPEKTGLYNFKRFKTVLDKLGLYVKDKYSLYSLKATGNRRAFDAGWDLMQISIQNRHTTITQTENYLRRLKRDVAAKGRPKMPRIPNR